MDYGILAKAGIDFVTGIERFAGKHGLYLKYLCSLPDRTEYSLLCKAMEKRDFESAFTYAHTLKGMTGSLGINKLYADFCLLTEHLRKSADTEAAISDMKVIIEDFKAMTAVINDFSESVVV